MKVPSGFKRWTKFTEQAGAPACINNGIFQKEGAKTICDSCPTRQEGLIPAGCFDVPLSERADSGSEKAGLKTWNCEPTCCHLGQRAVIGSEWSELQKKFLDEA